MDIRAEVVKTLPVLDQAKYPPVPKPPSREGAMLVLRHPWFEGKNPLAAVALGVFATVAAKHGAWVPVSQREIIKMASAAGFPRAASVAYQLYNVGHVKIVGFEGGDHLILQPEALENIKGFTTEEVGP